MLEIWILLYWNYFFCTVEGLVFMFLEYSKIYCPIFPCPVLGYFLNYSKWCQIYF